MLLKIKTKFFGEADLPDSSMIRFENGIPGFENLHLFALISDADEPDLHYLQSAEEESVCFVVTPPAALVGSYDIDINDELVQELGIEDPTDVYIYTILTIPEALTELTANLKAPILVNFKNRRGVQGVLSNTRYSIRHKIISEVEEATVTKE